MKRNVVHPELEEVNPEYNHIKCCNVCEILKMGVVLAQNMSGLNWFINNLQPLEITDQQYKMGQIDEELVFLHYKMVQIDGQLVFLHDKMVQIDGEWLSPYDRIVQIDGQLVSLRSWQNSSDRGRGSFSSRQNASDRLRVCLRDRMVQTDGEFVFTTEWFRHTESLSFWQNGSDRWRVSFSS